MSNLIIRLWCRKICFIVFAILTAAASPMTDISLAEDSIVNVTSWEPRLGDFDQMVENRVIRALVPHSKTFYFLDDATPRGITYEALKYFEKAVNKQLGTGVLKVNVLVIPTARDRLIPALEEGLGDIAAGNLTITKERLAAVDFVDPWYEGVNEVLVTGAGATGVQEITDLGGMKIHVRKSSSYYASLVHYNEQAKQAGRKPITIVPVNEYLEDEDLLEMVNAGLIPMVVVDSHKAAFWTQIFENIRVHEHIRFRENGRIAWAIRKNSPQLKTVINRFWKKNKKGTLLGNVLFNRYLKSTQFVQDNYTQADQQRLEGASVFFKKYAEIYDFDWLMLAALAYQESTIDQTKRSHDGAVGVMQVLPSTASDKNVRIADIEEIEPNIHAGTKYLRFIMDQYFSDPDIDELNKVLLSFAAYNAGPRKVAKLRRQAARNGLDPNVWFRNVEIVAARKIGRETVQYVSNIFKYYIAYRLIFDAKMAAQAS